MCDGCRSGSSVGKTGRQRGPGLLQQLGRLLPFGFLSLTLLCQSQNSRILAYSCRTSCRRAWRYPPPERRPRGEGRGPGSESSKTPGGPLAATGGTGLTVTAVRALSAEVSTNIESALRTQSVKPPCICGWARGPQQQRDQLVGVNPCLAAERFIRSRTSRGPSASRIRPWMANCSSPVRCPRRHDEAGRHHVTRHNNWARASSLSRCGVAIPATIFWTSR